MANIYVRSTDGNDADSGATWALSKASLTGAAAIDAAGDNIYISQAHAESTAAVLTLAFAGTPNNPVKIICGNDAAEPPSAPATTATVSTSGDFGISLQGSFHVSGVEFIACVGGSGAQTINLGGTGLIEYQTYKNCLFSLASSSGGAAILLGGVQSISKKINWENVRLKFANAGQRILVYGPDFTWRGGSIDAGSTTPNGLIKVSSTGRSGRVLIDGVDMSNFSSALSLVDSVSMACLLVFRNCKLPAAWAGALFNNAINDVGFRAEMYNCDSGDTNYRLLIEDYAGRIKSETALVRTGGASDGITPLSWKMTSSANVNYPTVPQESGEIVIWNDTVGSAKTATVEILHDSVTNLTDAEIWLEVQYLGTSGFPLSSFVTNAKSGVLAAAADQASSTATWTTTGMTNPNKQKLSVTFTPQEKGFIHAKVALTKASKTVYVDPVLTVA